jgi:hypothetical protein
LAVALQAEIARAQSLLDELGPQRETDDRRES